MLNKVRDLKKEAQGSKAAGFTIIEVMIVLAIAGLIMAIVFLAIPALQRNNRNTQRKNDASRVAGLISDYVSNNNGTLPTGANFNSAAAGTLDLTKEKFSIIDNSANVAVVSVASGCAAGTEAACPAAPTTDTIKYLKNADCGAGRIVPQYNSSARAFAIYYYIEGTTATQCIAS